MNINGQSRRKFLSQLASFPLMARAPASLAFGLAAMGEVAAQSNPSDEYKAIVCVFLVGGNDQTNTIIPADQFHHQQYAACRPGMFVGRENLLTTALRTSDSITDRYGAPVEYAFHPALGRLVKYFDDGSLSTILNIGNLVVPTRKFEFENKSVPLPPRLFSHNDQQSVWQSGGIEGTPTGWGGRLADVFLSGNGKAIFSCVNAGGNCYMLSGQQALAYQVGLQGATVVSGIKTPLYGSQAASDVLREIMIESSSTGTLERDYSSIAVRSITSAAYLNTALQSTPNSMLSFPKENSGSNKLSEQLQIVARMIAASNLLEVKRQVFFVSMGGFDTHNQLSSVHPALIAKVASALDGFHTTLRLFGKSSQVTTFTASDFGRTSSVDVDGSDHGWGSHHILMGDSVNGGKHFGLPPIISLNGPDDAGRGRLIPTTAVDQLVANLASWFGVPESDIPMIAPNIQNFDAISRNLGLLKSAA